MGGDTDTNCAIVGSLAEAYYGIPDTLVEQAESKIPDNFVKVLKKRR
jgi:ADP-ribosylglycohydrolase